MELFQKLSRSTTLLFFCGKILDFADFQHSHVVSKYWVTHFLFLFSPIHGLERWKPGPLKWHFLKRFIYLLYYLLIFLFHCCAQAFSSCGKRGPLSSCSARASHFGGFPCCRAWASGSQASVVERMSSVVGTRRLRCSMSYGLCPDQALNQCPLHCKVDS